MRALQQMIPVPASNDSSAKGVSVGDELDKNVRERFGWIIRQSFEAVAGLARFRRRPVCEQAVLMEGGRKLAANRGAELLLFNCAFA